jgi:hypothetical protein
MERVVAVQIGAPVLRTIAAVVAVGVLKPGWITRINLRIAVGVGNGYQVNLSIIEEEGNVRVHAISLGKVGDIAHEDLRPRDIAGSLAGKEEDTGLGARAREVSELEEPQMARAFP